MAVQIGLLVTGLIVIAAVAVAGIEKVHEDLGVAVQGYQELRQVYDAGVYVMEAQTALEADPPQPARAASALESALVKLEVPAYGTSADSPVPRWLDESRRADCVAALRRASASVSARQTGPEAGAEAGLAAIRPVLGQLSRVSGEVRLAVESSQAEANHRRRQTLEAVGGLSVLIVIAGAVVGLRHYRQVLRPLDRLGRGARLLAAGNWQQRIDAGGCDREFAALADDFNAMAVQLAGAYQQLEQKVARQSRELVQSERLASVGYLAAGVAHEINNPLGIIAGYGERSLQLLERPLEPATLSKARNAIRVMCEEAFRCKGITDKLLSLSRSGADERRPVALLGVCGEVLSAVEGLGNWRDRRITLEAGDDAQLLRVCGREAELKQVLLNLLLNALAATDSEAGQIRLTLRRDGDWLELSVADNGRGMSADTLQRVFEPFFTEKRGRNEGTGTGLGLSITHAIVRDHGGTIVAESAGPGLGSRFVVRLPVVENSSETGGEHVVSRA